MTANFYTSTRDPNAMLVAVIGTDRSQRKPLARAKITMDFTNLHYHDYDGFGVNMPGLIVTGAGKRGGHVFAAPRFNERRGP